MREHVHTAQLTRRHLLGLLTASGLSVSAGANLTGCSANVAAPATSREQPATVKQPTQAVSATSASRSTAASTNKAARSAGMAEVTWLTRTVLVEHNWETRVAIPTFQAEHPHIAVHLISVPGPQFDPKLFSLAAAGTPVDVWSHWGTSGFADYVHKGLVADLTPLIATDHYDLNAFQPGMVDIFRVQGRYMGLPNDTTYGWPLFYDSDLLRQAGIQPPPPDWDHPWAWEQFVEAGKKLTKDYGSVNGNYGIRIVTGLQLLALWGGMELYSPEAAATGTAKPADYHADTPEVLAGVQAVYNLMYVDRAMPTPQILGTLGVNGQDPFQIQRLAMFIRGGGGYWNYSTIREFTWATGADPKLKTNRTVGFTDPWMLSSKSADPEAAWTFIKYLLSSAGQLAYTKATGAPPANKNAAEYWQQHFAKSSGMTLEQVALVTQGALTHAKESYNHLLAGYDQIIKAENSALNNVWMGKMSPHAGLQLAKQQVDAVLAALH
ncbi:MAG: extracellular solute-binding protein [Chloroflexi bacterium]|nr:extracellular solute-binding protein [Chloroflexota bacterium]